MKITSSHRSPRNTRDQKGFTLIELLVAVAIVGVLATIGGSVFTGASEKAAMMREISGAKNLLTAFAAYTTEHSGQYMAGQDEAARGYSLPDGTDIPQTEATRYPYRLAPYFEYKMEGTVLINENIKQIRNATFPTPTYGVSLCPALGMNYLFVGGYYRGAGESVLQGADEVATRQAHGANLLVFASAGYKHSDGKLFHGFWKVEPPYVGAKDNNWGTRASSWNSDSEVKDFGGIDPRYGGKAVCAFLDGSVRMMTVPELSDMRLWNKNAVAQDNPNYTIVATSGGGRR